MICKVICQNILLSLLIASSFALTACSRNDDSNNIITSQDSQIIGGQILSDNNPISNSIVLIYDAFEGQVCTAVLITKNIALTAAHCIGLFPGEMYIFLGTSVSMDSPSIPIEKIEVSPYWETNRGSKKDTGDLALVYFSEKLPINYKPAIRYNKIFTSIGEQVVVAGYGITDGKSPEGAGQLRTTQQSVLQPRYGTTEFTVDQSKGRGICQGDSGGPAYRELNGRLYLVGIISRGVDDDNQTCQTEAALTYTAPYQRWIDRMILKLSRPLINSIP